MNANGLEIKVCGMTRRSDISMAMGMGARYCGFIFHPGSVRYITPARAAQLTSAHIRRVGVFVRQDAEEILSIMDEAQLDFAQLHGAQSLDCARRIGAARVIRVLWPDRYESRAALEREMELWADSCSHFLLDAGVSGGGHGETLAWEKLSGLHAPRPWFLAGGISAETLPAALSVCRPDGIDLNSGIELSPGQKSPRCLLSTLHTLTLS